VHAQRELYNAALEERIDCYRKTGKTRTYIDQCKALTECRRELPDMGELPANLQRWTLKRLDEAFQGIFPPREGA
jgi:putative transposase